MMQPQHLEGMSVFPAYPYRKSILLSTNGDETRADSSGGRARGVTFHEFGHYFFRFVLDHLHGDGDPWPFDSGEPWMVSALDEGVNYYLPSAYVTNFAGGKEAIGYAASHCDPGVSDQWDRFFLTRSKIDDCIGHNTPICEANYEYNGPQFQVSRNTSYKNNVLHFRESYVDGAGTPYTVDRYADVLPGSVQTDWFNGFELATALQGAMNSAGECDYKVVWLPGAGANGVTDWPGASGFEVSGDHTGVGTPCETMVQFQILIDSADSVGPTIGLDAASTYTGGVGTTVVSDNNVPNDSSHRWGYSGSESRAYDNNDFLVANATCGGVDYENDYSYSYRREDNVHFVGDWVSQSLWEARATGCSTTEVDESVYDAMYYLAGLTSCGGDCDTVVERVFHPAVVFGFLLSCPSDVGAYVDSLEAHEAYDP